MIGMKTVIWDARVRGLVLLGFSFSVWLNPGLSRAAGVDSTRFADPPGVTASHWVEWTPKADPAAQPSAGEDAAMAYDRLRRRVVLFGGKGDDDVDLDELWCLDVSTQRWQEVERRGDWPPASEDHTMIYDPVGDQMIVFGGENGKPANKTWSLDLSTFTWHDLTNSTAPYREDHTAVYDSRARRMIVFAGRDTFLNTPSDVWAFDLDPKSPRWHRWDRIPAGDRAPLGRTDHAAIYDSTGNRMVVFGGWDRVAREYLGDTWVFQFPDDPDSPGRWEKIRTKTSHPPRRRHVVGVHDPLRNWFIIMGGRGEEGFLNDVWALDLNYLVWINMTPGPEPRLDHQAVYDPESHRMLLYGGDAHLDHKLRDVWELEIRSALELNALLRAAGANAPVPGGAVIDAMPRSRGDER